MLLSPNPSFKMYSLFHCWQTEGRQWPFLRAFLRDGHLQHVVVLASRLLPHEPERITAAHPHSHLYAQCLDLVRGREIQELEALMCCVLKYPCDTDTNKVFQPTTGKT